MAKVLVVDDHPDSREVLVLMLQMSGHSATACESGEAAMAALNSHPLDVMVVDDRMSGMTGLEVVQRVRQDGRFEKVFLIVCSADGSSQPRALAGGANDFWTKGSEGMLQAIEKLEAKLLAWRGGRNSGPAAGT
jgi:CheY-like chemotaxis protein